MPTVKLSRSECSRGLLPSVCMRCGAPADNRKSRTFSWFPPIAYIGLIAGILPFAIIALVLTKRMSVSVPLCHEHRGHWSTRTTITVVSLLALILMGVGFIVYTGNQPPGPGGDLSGIFCLGWVGALIIWLILVAILQAGSIRATEITDRTVKLTGVHDGFIAALEEDRERDRDDGRERRRRYNDVRDDYDDELDEPPPRRSRPRDSYDDEGDRPRRRAWDK